MGASGAFRANSLDASAMGAMQSHELRLDLAGKKRRVRDVEPLIYSPHGSALDLKQSYEAHVRGAARNKGARNLCLHAFIQFPTDLKITPETERLMLDEATKFVNLHHGGNAVFRSRLDRDEAGRHGVDVFYAPRYQKKTAKGTAEWISLTKFGKELAMAKFGERPKKDKKTKEPVLDKAGKPVMVKNDNSYFQGQALQDLWFQHMRDEMKLDWVQRGEKKLGRDPVRLEPEEYKLKQEREKLDKQREAEIADAIERNKMVERTAELAETARKKLMDTAKAKAEEAEKRAVEAEGRVRAANDALATLKAAQRAAQGIEESIAALNAREKSLKASVALSEGRLTSIETDSEAAMSRVEELRKAIKGLEAKKAELRNAVQLTGDGAENFEVAMQEVARVTSAAAGMTLTNDLLATAQTRAFKDDQGQTRRFAQDDAQDNLVVRFITFGFRKAAELFEKIQSFARFNDEVERARTFPEPLMQMQNVVKGLREAVTETLTQLGVADQRPDVGEVDENGDPPPVLELVFTRAAQKGKSLNNELAARLGPSGPSMR